MTGVQLLEVAGDEAEIRLDRWFRRRFPGLGHGRLEKLLRTGQIRVDGARAKAATRLSPGQTVRVPPLGDDDRPARPAPPAAPDETLVPRVLYRDAELIAIDKPGGLAVQGGSGVTRHVDAMLDALRFGAPERPRLVHRLDKDTSGILLLGRSASAAARLAAAFRAKDTRKTYWALVAGVPQIRHGRIDLALAKRRIGGQELVQPDAEDGKRAVTLYRVREAAGRKVASLALRPVTGRTHQLRVHCVALGTPILGDGKYGGQDAHPDFLARLPGAGRLHLHARAIEIPAPLGRTVRIAAPLPPELRASWEFFGFDADDDSDPFAGLD